MIEIIESPHLSDLATIQHGTFTRKGGVSTGMYSTLNCSYGNEMRGRADKLENVRENRRRAMSQIHHSLESLVSVQCMHGKEAVIVKTPWDERLGPQADAMVTEVPGLVLGSDSADCPTIFFVDEIAGVIGLAHAGWRGAKSGVLEETVKKMLSIGAKTTNISAVIAPCISQNSYEVGPEFYQEFINENTTNQQYFNASKKTNHYFFDLRSYVKKRLMNLNLKRVSAIEMDTYTNEDLFFSCRRTFHRGEKDFGGNLSFISLKKI